MIQSNVAEVSTSFIHPKDYIRSHYLTYQEAADLFNVELSTIHRWLSGKCQPSKKYWRLATEMLKK